MKVYVCGPMTGLPDLNYPAFVQAEAALVAVGYEVLNPARVDQHHKALDPDCGCHYDGNEKHTWEWYMDQCLPMVREAEGLAVLPGWMHSAGAKIEVDLALSEVLIPVASLPTWIARHRLLQKEDHRPHSRACGIAWHDHGPKCHSNCPTCGGK